MMKNRILRVLAMVLALMLLMVSSGLAEILRVNSTGEAVVRLQQALKQLGYYSGELDGEYGQMTKKAVMAFQEAYDLEADGKAGSATQYQLKLLTGIEVSDIAQPGESTGNPSPEEQPTEAPAEAPGLFKGNYTKLEKDSRGSRVRVLQNALIDLGFDPGKADGVYGDKTVKAVQLFQALTDLSVDGKAGPQTLKKLESYFDDDGKLISQPIITGNPETSAPTPTPSPENTEPVNTKGLFKGNYSKLVFGAVSSRVRILQKALLALGYDIAKVDGAFGSQTYAAVKEFQKTVGLEADGVAGSQTLKALEAFFDEDGTVISGPIVTTPPPADDEQLAYGEPTRVLRKGMSGLDVQYTQDRLKALGYYKGDSDGQFGSGMYAAVKAFQDRNGLSADGVIGSRTRQVLFSTGAIGAEEIVPSNPGDRVLQPGMEGDDVLAVQVRLSALGYYNGKLDGKYGTDTVEAVKAFQKRNDLRVDGACGEDTVKVLFSNEAIDAGSSIEPSATPLPTNTPDRVLKQGMEGADVAYVQTRLTELGYYADEVDGVYGKGTVAAVKYFQARNSLTVDGKVGAMTSAKLFSDDAIPAYSGEATTPPVEEVTPAPQVTPSRTLRLGSQGEDVKLVQVRLITLGYLNGTADGIYGKGTVAAVEAFQLRNGLSADGISGSKTYKKLFSDDAIAAPSATDNTPTRELYAGCTGDDVKKLQSRLVELGFLTDAADGKFGANTKAAVIAFQQMNGLTADGRTDGTDYAVLFSDSAITSTGQQVGDNSTVVYTTLTIGSTGNAVIRLQQMLSALKYNVSVTGTYDETTYAAVLAFQKRNNLDPDGIAGKLTQTKLYSGSCVTGDTLLPEDDTASGGVTGNGGGPSTSQVKWLWWYDEIKPTIKSGQTVLVYEPSSGSSFYLRLYSLGRHADSEPLTANDTAIMKAAWGGKFSWSEKPVYIRLPNGTWCIASMHSMPHLSGGLANNDFDGHLCVHFPRTIEECIAAGDSKNGVRHQNDIRKHWLALTGENITY